MCSKYTVHYFQTLDYLRPSAHVLLSPLLRNYQDLTLRNSTKFSCLFPILLLFLLYFHRIMENKVTVK